MSPPYQHAAGTDHAFGSLAALLVCRTDKEVDTAYRARYFLGRETLIATKRP